MHLNTRLSDLVAAIERLELEPTGEQVLGRGIQHHLAARQLKAVEAKSKGK